MYGLLLLMRMKAHRSKTERKNSLTKQCPDLQPLDLCYSLMQ
jgi:hypothetical protein